MDKNTEFTLEKRELFTLILSIILISFGITLPIGILFIIFLILRVFNRIVRKFYIEKVPNVKFVN